VLGALRDAETSLNTYVHDLQREDSTRKARDEAERAARESERLQVAGRHGARRRRFAKGLRRPEQTLAQLETAIAEDQIAVFLALGGGWQEETARSTAASETASR
jgi:outer membrane protein, multidrug efflux system